MTQKHVLGDGAINVRDDNLVVPVPQIDGAFAATCALVLSGDAKCHIIRSLLQFEAGLVTQADQSKHVKAQMISFTVAVKALV